MANSPARSVVDVGTVIADTYMIEALIGRGGMGAVFLASHRRLPGKKVAIKVLHAELTDPEVVARFRREALIASQLAHPNIVDVTDFNVTSDGVPYLVLEYLHGESLAQRIRLGPMALGATLSILRQVGSAVAAAHRAGIVHRDLKPQNIFLVPQEVDGRILEIAKVLDFGISKIRGSQTVLTQESTLLGTPQYMAPEQATGQHAQVDERTDIFALGAIAYEMLSGQPAFSGASIPEVVFKVVYEAAPPLDERVPGLALGIVHAVTRAMAKRPPERFPSVGDFIEALTGQPLLPPRATLPGAPEAGFAAGSRHRSGPTTPGAGSGLASHDAFAQTMGSEDGHQPAIAPAGTAATRSVSRTEASTARLGMSGPPATRAPAGRRVALALALALALAATGAAAAYVVLRRDSARAPAAPGAPVPALARADAAPPPPSTEDAGHSAIAPLADAAVADAAPPRDGGAAVPPLPRPPPVRGGAGPGSSRSSGSEPRPGPTSGDGSSAGDDETATRQLGEAESALAAGDYDRAERLANTVASSPDARARQRARAHAIRGVVRCVRDRDQEGGAIALRQLRGFRPLQTRLALACKSVGIDLR